MRITQDLVKEVKRSNAKQWHDQAWHDFQGLKEVEAINFALWEAELENKFPRPSLADIVKSAKHYMTVTSQN